MTKSLTKPGLLYTSSAKCLSEITPLSEVRKTLSIPVLLFIIKWDLQVVQVAAKFLRNKRKGIKETEDF